MRLRNPKSDNFPPKSDHSTWKCLLLVYVYHYWCWLMLLDAGWFWFIQIDPFFSLLCVVSFRHFLMNRTRCIEVKIVLVAFHQNQLYLLFKYNVDKFCKRLHVVYISIISVYYNHMINYAGQTASPEIFGQLEADFLKNFPSK